MPTTLSSGVALTQLAEGNSALALAMTLASNLLGVLTVPLTLLMFMKTGPGLCIPTMELFKSLVSLLLVPLIIGKVFREAFKSLSEFVDKNRRAFSMASAVLLGLVPCIQVSRSRSLLLTVQPVTFVIAICLGVVLHLSLLAFNSLAVWSLSVVSGGNKSILSKKENVRAIILVASQKTLPVMVTIVEQLGGSLGEPVLLILPCVAAHIIQIIIDSFMVNAWLRGDRLSKRRE